MTFDAAANVSAGATPWPYPVHYGRETEAEFDVLVIGGGIAGCHAAINAARAGRESGSARQGAVIRSGSGGAGWTIGTARCRTPAAT